MSTLASVVIRDLFANRPTAGIAGRLFFASDTGKQYRDNGTTWDDITPQLVFSAGISIDGGGATITTGVKGYVSIPVAGTITGWDITADQTGSISIDVLKHAMAIPNTTTDKISASAPIALSSAQLAQNQPPTGWATSIAANDVIGFNVTSATTVQRVTAFLRVTR